MDVESMGVDDDDRMLLADVLDVPEVDASAIQPAADDAMGTTGRVHRFRLDGRTLVAKIADDPVTAERAAREVAVLSALARDAAAPLRALAPRFVAGRVDTPPVRPRTIVVTEWIDGHHADPAVGITDDRLHEIAAAMGPAWNLTAHDVRAAGIDLPTWGVGTVTSDHARHMTRDDRRAASAHRRRGDRFRRRAADLRRHHPDAADRVDRVLREIGDRYEALAAAAITHTGRTGGTGSTAHSGRPPRLIHGDLHLGNVLFTTEAAGGALAGRRDESSSRIRVIDWQTASLGDPVHDLARFAMESLRDPTFASVHAATRHLPDPTDDAAVARAILLAFTGFVVGLAGRDPSSLIDADRRLVERLLTDETIPDLLRESVDRAGDRSPPDP
jgi:Ser/Thr protein kinase RdoA (MazF antagonist)